MGKLFGTDGVRGMVNCELTCEDALGIGRAAARVLGRGAAKRPVFLIGGDTRASTDMLTAAVAAGVCSEGVDVDLLGVVPTPAVAYLVRKRQADAGIVISASHNPHLYNGIKIFGPNGHKVADDLEKSIEDLFFGKVSSAADGAVGCIQIDRTAVADYVSYLGGTISEKLSGLRIALDCANGAACATSKALFFLFQCQSHWLSCNPTGTNINLSCGSTHPENLADYVVKHRLDAGFAFDGDADRLICVDEKGNLVDGDSILAICALDMKKRGELRHNTVVGTVMSNLGLMRYCEQNQMQFVATRVGDRFIWEKMLEGDFALGGEPSGHIIFRHFATTGDGQLTALRLLAIMAQEKKPLSQLSAMTPYPQHILNLSVTPEGKRLFASCEAISEAIGRAEAQLGQNGRLLVRPSGTEPLIRIMAESTDEKAARRAVKDVANAIKMHLEK